MTLSFGVEDLRRLKVVGCARGRCIGCLGTSRLVGDLCRTSYDLNDPTHVTHFGRAVQMFERLLGSELAPELAYIDLQRGSIYHSSYKPVNPSEFVFNRANFYRELEELVRTLRDKHKIVRTSRNNPNINTTNIPFPQLARNPKGKLIITSLDNSRWKLLSNN